MVAKSPWNVALLETDKPQFSAWLARCRKLGIATNMAGAIRLAVTIAEAASYTERKAQHETTP